MALLGMMDQRRPSEVIENKRERNNGYRWNGRMDMGRKDSKRNLYSEKDKDKRDSNNHINEKDFCSRPNTKQNYIKDSRTSSNNLILTTVLLIQDGLVYEKYVSEARITQLIDQVISNQKIKDILYDLRFYREKGVKYTADYIDYLVEYEK